MHIKNMFLTLNASKSFNPNEKEDNKKNLLYTWECNIIEDNNCKKITTTSNYYLYIYIYV